MNIVQVFVLLTGCHVCIPVTGTDRGYRYGTDRGYRYGTDRDYRYRIANGLEENSRQSGTRHIRAASVDPRRNCSTWSPWVDEHKPSPSDKTDSESLTAKELADFCPITYGGTISKFECNDEKGESFNTNKTSGNNKEFFIGCYDVNIGVTCTVIKSTTDPCPDLQIRYFCACSSQVPLTQISTTDSTTTRTEGSLANYSQSTSTSKKVETFNLCSMTVAWWVFILLLCLIMFLINVLLTVCLYKRAVKKMGRKKIKIHPLEKV